MTGRREASKEQMGDIHQGARSRVGQRIRKNLGLPRGAVQDTGLWTQGKGGLTTPMITM